MLKILAWFLAQRKHSSSVFIVITVIIDSGRSCPDLTPICMEDSFHLGDGGYRGHGTCTALVGEMWKDPLPRRREGSVCESVGQARVPASAQTSPLLP